jgi:hypothetical protein
MKTLIIRNEVSNKVIQDSRLTSENKGTVYTVKKPTCQSSLRAAQGYEADQASANVFFFAMGNSVPLNSGNSTFHRA